MRRQGFIVEQEVHTCFIADDTIDKGSLGILTYIDCPTIACAPVVVGNRAIDKVSSELSRQKGVGYRHQTAWRTSFRSRFTVGYPQVVKYAVSTGKKGIVRINCKCPSRYYTMWSRV